MSTVIQPCNFSGFFDGAEKWGLVSFDWNNARDLWMQHPLDETTCEELLVSQAMQVKSLNPNTKVFVYRNMELALEWLSSERAAMYNESMSDFFLKYQTGPNAGQIYNEPVQFGSQYFWNFTNPAAVEYWINEVAVLLFVSSVVA
jgi:hypothetical protein